MSKNNSPTSAARTNSAPGTKPARIDAIGAAMRVMTTVTGSEFAERFGLRKRVDRVTYEATKSGFRTLGAATKSFKKVSGGGKATRLPDAGTEGAGSGSSRSDLFDLTPDDEQKMIVSTVRDFATEVMRPAAFDADAAAQAPEALLARSAEIGATMLNVPEEFEGIASERGVVTNALVAEALAYGDMGLALPILAPSGVATTLTQFGSDAQQKSYLPAFASEHVPAAAVVVAEPRPLFDPFDLRTTATRGPGGYVLDGVKSLVPTAGSAELFVVAAELDGKPTFFVVESDTEGLVVEADPSMGLRAAGLGRLVLTNVTVPADAILGGDEASTEDRDAAYADVVRLSRLGWASLAVGTCHAVLDYVTPYVKEREAFGEPIAHRQAVAFAVADMATELDGMRLVTWRGASRAEQLHAVGVAEGVVVL